MYVAYVLSSVTDPNSPRSPDPDPEDLGIDMQNFLLRTFCVQLKISSFFGHQKPGSGFVWHSPKSLDPDPESMHMDPTSVADPRCLSRILIFTHPGSRIQKQQQKEG
jgi:hypothetical protein